MMRCSLVVLALLSVASGEDAYSVLGVARTASSAEIKAAYRKQALAHHPDKGGDESMFVKVAQAYEAVGVESARRRYDAGGRSAARRDRDWDARATEMFRESFGDELWRNWEEGATVTGTLSRGGERVEITIFPDGSVEEVSTTSAARRGASTVSRVTRTDASGRTSSMTSISLEGSFGDALAAAVVPDWLAGLPGIGPGLAWAVAWVPTLLGLGLCWRCCCAPAKKRHEA